MGYEITTPEFDQAKFWENFVDQALDPNRKNTSWFDEKHRSVRKDSLQLCMNLAATPATNNPYFDPDKQSLSKPTILGLIQLYTYHKLGPVYYLRNGAPPPKEQEKVVENPPPSFTNPLQKKNPSHQQPLL